MKVEARGVDVNAEWEGHGGGNGGEGMGGECRNAEWCRDIRYRAIDHETKGRTRRFRISRSPNS